MDKNINNYILEEIENEFLNADETRLKDGWDHYQFNDNYIPRVSHIIHSCQLDNESLIVWANKMGFKHIDSQTVKENAAMIGTYIHEAIEDYIMTGNLPDIYEIPSPDKNTKKIITGFEGFKSFWDNYRYKDLISNVEVEQTILTPYFGGTYDLKVTLKDGRIYLYDFKSTNTIRESQFIQLSAYRFGLREYYNTTLSGVAILKIDKYRPSCKEYMVDFSLPNNLGFINQCEKTFISMLYAYYNMKMTAIQFNDYKNRR